MSTGSTARASYGHGRRRTLLDDVAIREFLATAYPRLLVAVTLVAGSRAAAEDAVHEALARAWERSAHGEEIESLPAWVTRVAMNLSKSRLRRVRVESRAREAMRPEVRTVIDSGERLEIGAAVANLPRRQREVTVLRFYLGMDIAEIASVLRVSEGTVKTSLHRARQALAAALDDTLDEEADDARAR
jgi:RNA polymerase sigma factor (sigma-70 family)